MPETAAAGAPAPQRAVGDELYVGYLPVPRGQLRFLWRWVPVVVFALCGACVLWALSQPNPGAAVWDDSHVRVFEGTIAARPYPVLFAEDAGDGKPGAMLLVEVGKRGGARAAALDGKRARVSGWLLVRDGRRMIEMEPGDAALRAADEPAARVERRPPATGSRVTLLGEIVDGKCYLGAMKPGDGKTHKACATLCITGGLPAMLVVPGSGGSAPSYYLLASPEGGPLEAAAFDRIGEPVQVQGEVSDWGPEAADGAAVHMRVLTVRPQDILRL